jgi:hypothetical protein
MKALVRVLGRIAVVPTALLTFAGIAAWPQGGAGPIPPCFRRRPQLPFSPAKNPR